MPTIQNQINLYVNANGQLVSGSEPTNVLYRNTLNKNTFFIITPLSQAAIVKLIFKNTSLSKQGYTGVAKPTLKRGWEVTSKEVSYYNLVKDWNVFIYVPSSRILTKFPSTVTGSIGISVLIKEPDLSDTTKYTNKGDVFVLTGTDLNRLNIGEYYKCIASKLEVTTTVNPTTFTLYTGDKLLCVNRNTPEPEQYVIIRSLWTRSVTEPLLFVGNPSLEDDDYEDTDVGPTTLLDSIIATQTEQSGSILQLQDYLTFLTTKYDNIQITIDGINHDILVLQGEVANRYPYYIDETDTTKDLNNNYNTQTGFIYYLSSSKAFLNGPISGQVASPILIQNIGNRQIYFDVTSNKTYTRLRPSNTWTYASEIMVQKYNADLSLKEVVPLENTSKVLIDKDAFELLRTLLTDKVSVETIGSNNLPYSLSLTEFLRLIATPSETLQTKSSVAKYIESLGLLDNINLVNLSSLHGLAQGAPYLDGVTWKLDFEHITVNLEDLNMWKDINGGMYIWFANEAEQINFTPTELPYEFSIEDVITKKCELNTNITTFRSSFNLNFIRMTLTDVSNGKDITDIINNPEYNFTMTLDNTQGSGGFIPFQYSNDNLVFTSFDGNYLQFNATERTSTFYKGRTTVAIKITFTIAGENITLLQKVTVNVTGTPVVELDDSFELDSTTEDFYNTGLYITNNQKLEVVRKGNKVYQVLMENPFSYRIFLTTDNPIPEWKRLATFEDIEDFITANDLPDLLTDYATNESVNAKDATTLLQAKAYADQKIAEAVAADIIAKTNYGFKTNADYSQVTLVAGQTTFDFETNTIYTYDGTAWGNPIEVTPQENSEVKLGEWVGPDTDVDINGNSMRGVGVNAVYDTTRGWLYYITMTIVNNITKESDVTKITILSGTGSELNPYVIDKDFRDGHRYYFESTVVPYGTGSVTVYFSYNGEIFSTSAQVFLLSSSVYPSLSSYKDTVFNGIFSPYHSGLGSIKTSPTIVYDAVRNYILVDMLGGLVLSPRQLVIGGSSGNIHAQIPNGVSGTALKSTGPNSNPAFDFLQNMLYDETRYLYEVINQGGGGNSVIDLDDLYIDEIIVGKNIILNTGSYSIEVGKTYKISVDYLNNLLNDGSIDIDSIRNFIVIRDTTDGENSKEFRLARLKKNNTGGAYLNKSRLDKYYSAAATDGYYHFTVYDDTGKCCRDCLVIQNTRISYAHDNTIRVVSPKKVDKSMRGFMDKLYDSGNGCLDKDPWAAFLSGLIAPTPRKLLTDGNKFAASWNNYSHYTNSRLHDIANLNRTEIPIISLTNDDIDDNIERLCTKLEEMYPMLRPSSADLKQHYYKKIALASSSRNKSLPDADGGYLRKEGLPVKKLGVSFGYATDIRDLFWSLKNCSINNKYLYGGSEFKSKDNYRLCLYVQEDTGPYGSKTWRPVIYFKLGVESLRTERYEMVSFIYKIEPAIQIRSMFTK